MHSLLNGAMPNWIVKHLLKFDMFHLNDCPQENAYLHETSCNTCEHKLDPWNDKLEAQLLFQCQYVSKLTWVLYEVNDKQLINELLYQ